MTELRYLPDGDDVTSFTATVTEATRSYIVLDGTYFYPEGGGQPADHGRMSWDGGRAEIAGVEKNHGDVRHLIESMEEEPPDPGTAVECEIDAERRDRLRRLHTAQHVVSRIVFEEYGAETAGNQIYPDRARIDFEPAEFDDGDLDAIERRANEVIDEDIAVRKENWARDVAEEEIDTGRALLELIPDAVDPLRIVAIGEFDACPCGGTHVDRTGEIGGIEVTDRTSKGADVDRVEFTLS